MAEGARLEIVCRGDSTVGSNPTLSATAPPPGEEAVKLWRLGTCDELEEFGGVSPQVSEVVKHWSRSGPESIMLQC